MVSHPDHKRDNEALNASPNPLSYHFPRKDGGTIFFIPTPAFAG